jgi:lipid A 3-O-deacylase PagL/OmpA family protein
MPRIRFAAAVLILCLGAHVSAQERTEAAAPAQVDTRTQYPAFLMDSYFGFSLGYINYDFSGRQLEPGFSAETVQVPHVAGRVVLFGHQFNKFLSAQLTYMRPVVYVSYKNVNGDQAGHHLFTHFGGVTLKPELPVTPAVSVYAEAGLGVTSRRRLAVGDAVAVEEAIFPSVLFGGGLEYHVNLAWDLTAGLTYSAGRERDNQPGTIFLSGGFQYNLRPLPADRVEANRQTDAIFPAHLIQIEYTTGVGYGVNDLFSKKVPIFWGGSVKVARGIAVHYDRNVFHTRRLFSLDLGTSVSYWRSRDERDQFATLSVYPLLRFTVLRAKPADFYVCYSLVGPTYVSKQVLDSRDTGNSFTFQDFMGIGAFIGKNRHLSAGLKINHYSNGNIFTRNAGIKVPLTVGVGYAF